MRRRRSIGGGTVGTLRARRSLTLPACAPQGLSRREGRHSRRSSAIGLMQGTGVSNMTTIHTMLNLRKFEARRLMRRGYEILHIETQHCDDGDETAIVWTRPPRPDDIPEHDLPTDVWRPNLIWVRPLSHVRCQVSSISQCAPTARFTSGGRIHPGSCR
jgi:hypothetical protein